MTQQVALVLEPKYPPTTLLFEKVVGLPLLLRNILALKKAGFKKIEVVLPANLMEEFETKVSGDLDQRGVPIHLITYLDQLPYDKITATLKIPAHAFVEEKLKPNYFQLIIDDAAKISQAERILLETIRLSTPGPVAKYLNKRISLPISLRLAKRCLHPNWITGTNMLLGLSTGFLVAQGTYLFSLLGGFLFQMASIFDGCDGEVAKLNYRTNKFGEYFDSLSDNGALISFFVGLVVAYSKDHNLIATLSLGSLLLVGLGGLFWQMILFLKRYTQSASLVTFDKEYLSKLSPKETSPLLIYIIRCGKVLMRKDCFSLFFFFLSLFGVLPWLFYLATGGLWIANFILLSLKQQPAPLTTYE